MGGKCPSYMVVILLFTLHYICSTRLSKELGRFGCGPLCGG
jgi:hypothetical protein